MKTMKSLFLFFAGLCLIVACNKDNQVIMPDYGFQTQNNAFICGKVFKVHPTNGTDITADLKQAFDDAKAAGPGSVVQLPKGNFELGFIEIHEFYGSLVGAGIGKTVITVKTGLDCNTIEQNQWGFLISFVGGDVFMSDMTLKYPKGESVCNDGSTLTGFLFFADYNAVYTSKNKYINAWVNNVEFTGEKLGDWWYSCWTAVDEGHDTKVAESPRSHIDLKVTNCIFNEMGWGTQTGYIDEGTVILGSKNHGNTYNNCAEAAVFYDFINVGFQIVDNKFNVPVSGWALDMDNTSSVVETQTKNPSFIIEGNEFNLVGAYGFWMHDHRLVSNPEENLPVLFQVRNNKFNLSDDAPTGTKSLGVESYEVRKPVFSDNQFTGTGDIGLNIAPSGQGDVYAEDCLIIGNNFSRSTFATAAILLNEWTRNWTVIGNVNASVIDQGTDNVIKNCNIRHHDHFGQRWPSPEDHMNFNKGKFRGPHHE